jgi:hypothetical protein
MIFYNHFSINLNGLMKSERTGWRSRWRRLRHILKLPVFSCIWVRREDSQIYRFCIWLFFCAVFQHADMKSVKDWREMWVTPFTHTHIADYAQNEIPEKWRIFDKIDERKEDVFQQSPSKLWPSTENINFNRLFFVKPNREHWPCVVVCSQ